MFKKIDKKILALSFCFLITLLVMGADLKEKTGVTLLSTTTGVAMGANATKANLYTVPAGKTCVVTMVIIRTLGSAVACGTNNDFGDGASADTWKTDVNLSTMDATDDYYVVTNDDTRIEATFDAGDVFGISTDEDSDASAVTATIEVFGYLF